MNVLRQAVSDQLFRHSITRHRSRLGWRDAPRYSTDWEACQQAMADPLPEPGALGPNIADFKRDGVTSFHSLVSQAVARSMTATLARREAAGETVWRDDPGVIGNNGYAGEAWRDFPELEDLFRADLGTFLQHYFGCHYRIWFALLYRNSPKREIRVGSQRWHSDSGPGSCVNVMFYLDETTPEDGPLEALPWKDALTIFRSERPALRDLPQQEDAVGDRDGALYDHYERIIAERHRAQVVQPHGPSGLVVPFLNNTLHRGGFPQPGHTRTALVFHCYPSRHATPFERYREQGLAKRGSYPKDPRESF